MKINTLLHCLFAMGIICVPRLDGSAPDQGKNYLDLLGTPQPLSVSDQIDADSKRQAQLKAQSAVAAMAVASMQDDMSVHEQSNARPAAAAAAAGAGSGLQPESLVQGRGSILRTKNDVTPDHYAKLAELSKVLGLPASAVAIRTQDGSMVTRTVSKPDRNKTKKLIDHFLGMGSFPIALLDGPLQGYMNNTQRYAQSYVWRLADIKNDPAITLMDVDANHKAYGDIVALDTIQNGNNYIVLDSNGMFHMIKHTAQGLRRTLLVHEKNRPLKKGIKNFHCIGKDKKYFAYVGLNSIVVRDCENFAKKQNVEFYASQFDSDGREFHHFPWWIEILSSSPDGKQLLIRNKQNSPTNIYRVSMDIQRKDEYTETLDEVAGHYLQDNQHMISLDGKNLTKRDYSNAINGRESVCCFEVPLSEIFSDYNLYESMVMSPKESMVAIFKTLSPHEGHEWDYYVDSEHPHYACVVDLKAFKVKHILPIACFLMAFSPDEKEVAAVIDEGDCTKDNKFHREIIVYALGVETYESEKAADSKEARESNSCGLQVPKELWRATSQEPIKKLLYGPNAQLLAVTKSGLSAFRTQFSMDQSLLDTMAKEQHDKTGAAFSLNALAESYNLDKQVVQQSFDSMALADQERLENCAGRSIENAQKIAMCCVKRLINEAGMTKQEKEKLEEKCILYLKMVKDLCKNNQQVLNAFERRIKAMVLREEKPFGKEAVEESNRRFKRHLLGLINQGLGDKGSVIS